MDDAVGQQTLPNISSKNGQSPDKSLDLSIGTDSPLGIRIRQKNTQVNSERGGPRDSESPREVIARRSMSIDYEPNVEQLGNVELKDTLVRFQQSVHKDSAETAMWLLGDTRRGVEETQSAFMYKESPFALVKPIKAVTGTATEEATKLKLDIYVRHRACSFTSL